MTVVESLPGFLLAIYGGLVLSPPLLFSFHFLLWFLFLGSVWLLLRSRIETLAPKAFAIMLLFPFAWTSGAFFPYMREETLTYLFFVWALFYLTRDRSLSRREWMEGMGIGILLGLQHFETALAGLALAGVVLASPKHPAQVRRIFPVLAGLMMGKILLMWPLSSVFGIDPALRVKHAGIYSPWMIGLAKSTPIWWWSVLQWAWFLVPWFRPLWKGGVVTAFAIGITMLTGDPPRVFNLIMFLPSFFLIWGNRDAVRTIPDPLVTAFLVVSVLLPKSWMIFDRMVWLNWWGQPLETFMSWTRIHASLYHCPLGSPGLEWYTTPWFYVFPLKL